MTPTTDITLSCENQLHQTFFLSGSCPALLQLSCPLSIFASNDRCALQAFFAVWPSPALQVFLLSGNRHDQFSSLVATAISNQFFTLQRLSCNTCHALKSICEALLLYTLLTPSTN